MERGGGRKGKNERGGGFLLLFYVFGFVVMVNKLLDFK